MLNKDLSLEFPNRFRNVFLRHEFALIVRLPTGSAAFLYRMQAILSGNLLAYSSNWVYLHTL